MVKLGNDYGMEKFQLKFCNFFHGAIFFKFFQIFSGCVAKSETHRGGLAEVFRAKNGVKWLQNKGFIRFLTNVFLQ